MLYYHVIDSLSDDYMSMCVNTYKKYVLIPLMDINSHISSYWLSEVTLEVSTYLKRICLF